MGAGRIESATGPRDRFETLGEIRDAARAVLAPEVWDYMEGGSGEEQTLADNEEAFARWRFRPRVMSGAAPADTRTEFVGIELNMPVLTAPVGADRYFHADGYRAVVRAAAAAGIASIVPEASSYSLELLAADAPPAAKIMQFHPWGDDKAFVERAQRAAHAGYALLCLTLDAPVVGWRERGKRSRFTFDLEAIAGNFEPGFSAAEQDMLQRPAGRGCRVWTWTQLADVAERLPLPFLVKGILTGDDAHAAVDAGAAGVVVSNHGARQLDGAPATLDQLPEIAEAVAGRVPIALDGGIRRGTDVLKALALGAHVVLLGRLVARGLAAEGEAGVQRTFELLRAELETSMTLLGIDRVDQLRPSLLQPARPAINTPGLDSSHGG